MIAAEKDRSAEWQSSEGQVREHTLFSEQFPEYQTGAAAEKDGQQIAAGDGRRKSRRRRRNRSKEQKNRKPGEGGGQPRKLAEWGSSYGKISAGLDEEQGFVMVVTKQRSRGIKVPPPASRGVDTVRMRRLLGQPGAFSINPVPGEEHSAVAYQEDKSKGAPFMAGRIRGMVGAQEHLELPQAIMPFMSDGRERVELAALREQGKNSAIGGAREEQQHNQRRIEYLEAELMHREQMQRDFMKKLSQAIAASRADAETGAAVADDGFFAFLHRLFKGEEEDISDGDDTGDAEENR